MYVLDSHVVRVAMEGLVDHVMVLGGRGGSVVHNIIIYITYTDVLACITRLNVWDVEAFIVTR